MRQNTEVTNNGRNCTQSGQEITPPTENIKSKLVIKVSQGAAQNHSSSLVALNYRSLGSFIL